MLISPSFHYLSTIFIIMREQAKHLNPTPRDKAWGIALTSVGQQAAMPDDGLHHDGYRLIYITRGCAVLEGSSTLPQRVHAGDMLLLHPGERYTLRPDTATEWEACHVAFEGHTVDEKIRTGFFDRRKPVFTIGIKESVTAIFKEIYTLADDNTEGSSQYAAGLVYMLLGRMLYEHHRTGTSGGITAQMILRAKTLMNADNNESMEQIAARVGLPYDRFRREFKRLCGISPGQFRMEQKMEKAKRLLCETDMSIALIAEQLGFGYQGELSALFRKHVGMPPLEFRKHHEACYTTRTERQTSD